MENQKNQDSELFIKQYNDCKEEGYSEFAARTFAKYYEIAILEKRAEGYAFNFAEAVSDLVANRYTIKDDYEKDDFFKSHFNEIKRELETKQFK